jgi:hypothetical protein
MTCVSTAVYCSESLRIFDKMMLMFNSENPNQSQRIETTLKDNDWVAVMCMGYGCRLAAEYVPEVGPPRDWYWDGSGWYCSEHQPTKTQRDAVWTALLLLEEQHREAGSTIPPSPSEIRDVANSITNCGHADWLMGIIQDRGGATKVSRHGFAVASSDAHALKICTVPGYENYQAHD